MGTSCGEKIQPHGIKTNRRDYLKIYYIYLKIAPVPHFILKLIKPFHICIISSHPHNSSMLLGSWYCCQLTYFVSSLKTFYTILHVPTRVNFLAYTLNICYLSDQYSYLTERKNDKTPFDPHRGLFKICLITCQLRLFPLPLFFWLFPTAVGTPPAFVCTVLSRLHSHSFHWAKSSSALSCFFEGIPDSNKQTQKSLPLGGHWLTALSDFITCVFLHSYFLLQLKFLQVRFLKHTQKNDGQVKSSGRCMP